jgi:hypothetical protein
LLLVEGRATVVLDGSPADPLSTSSPTTA